MYRKILVPLDGSNLSETILSQAIEMVKECGRPEIVLLTVVEPFREQPYRRDDDWVIKIQKQAVKVSGTYLQELKEKLGTQGIEVSTVVLEGDPAEQILDYAGKNGVDLIMMNARGRTASKRWIFGGVANRIIRHSPIPVLIASPTTIS
jgi:nucleotide-binding universal stress UspA family protein